MTTERAWADPLPTINVDYKNLTKVYFRVVKADYVERLKNALWRPEHLSQNEAQGAPESRSGTVLRPGPAGDARLQAPHRSEFPRRRGSKPGFYYLLAGHDESSRVRAPVVYTDFFVTDLAIVERQDYTSGGGPRAR